jgi:hypothetical protein
MAPLPPPTRSEIPANGRFTQPSTASGSADSPLLNSADTTATASRADSMSRQSQLAVVATSTIAFAGLLVYLSRVLYPLVVLGGAYVVMEQLSSVERHDSHLWQSFQTRLDQCRSMLAGSSDYLSAEKRTASRPPSMTEETSASISPTATAPAPGTNKPVGLQGSPKGRRSRVITVKNSTHAQPSLRVTNVGVTSDGMPQPLPGNSQHVLDYIVEPNSLEPYEFENDFMKGRLLFLLQRADSPTPPKYMELFAGKRRLFWVQLQVQFKKVPSGILYIGGEVPRSMNLGFFTGGLTKVILSVLQSLVRGLHCSFGQLFPDDVKNQRDEELPHICFPLYTAVDQFVVTPPGDKPPTLGTADFGESKEAMAARRKHGQPMFQYNTSDTYSFHFHSFFIDFAKWRLNGLPGMKDTELRTFWGDMPLRLCAYSLKPQAGFDPNSEADAKKLVHSWSAKEYNFCFQMSHKVQDQYEIIDDAVEGDTASSQDACVSEVAIQQAEMEAQLGRYEFTIPAWFEYFSSSRAHAERRVGYALRVREREGGVEYYVLLPAVAAFSPLSFVEHELTYTPVRRLSRGRSGSGTSFFSGSNKTKTLEEAISVKSHQSRYAKTDDERQFLEYQLTQLAMPNGANTKFDRKLVLQAQAALLEVLQRKNVSLGVEWPFLASASVRKNSFGSSANVLSDLESSNSGTTSSPTKEGLQAAHQIVRAISPTCWRNEWVTVDKYQRMLRFFRMMTSSPAYTISMDAILLLEDDTSCGGASVQEDDDEPMALERAELFWLRVVTIERCHHMAFASPEDRQQWSDAIKTVIEARGRSMDAVLKQPVLTSCQRVGIESFATDTGSKSKGAKRNVINDRCDFVTSHNNNTSSAAAAATSDPNALVAAALRQALRLQRDRLAEYSTRDFLGFLDTVGMLKWVKLDPILQKDEDERKVFLLNLYHLMLLHASLLGFLPRSKSQWSKFFNGVNYNVGGLYVSIAEVEHGLIRVPMASLKLAFAFLVIPKVNDQDDRAPLRLTKADFRVNFALNCLTKSCTNSLVVFTTQDLERQLDHMTSLTVDYSVSYDRESKILYLPKACEWYRADFTSDPGSRWHASCLALLRKYMVDGSNKAQLIDYLLQHERTLIAKWKFVKYDYRFHESVQEAHVPEPENEAK